MPEQFGDRVQKLGLGDDDPEIKVHWGENSSFQLELAEFDPRDLVEFAHDFRQLVSHLGVTALAPERKRIVYGFLFQGDENNSLYSSKLLEVYL